MDGVQIFNALEAAFWLLLALAAAATGHRTAGFSPGRQIALVVFLVGFGISDIWEIWSGAWWQPPALLALKATCLIGLIFAAAAIYQARWRRAAKTAD